MTLKKNMTVRPGQVADFSELVVRDFLRINGYRETLEVLNGEKRGSTPPADSWYAVAEEIGLADMLINLQGLAQSGCGSILEVMIMALLQENSVKTRRPATVSMVKRSEGTTGTVEIDSATEKIEGTGSKGGSVRSGPRPKTTPNNMTRREGSAATLLRKYEQMRNAPRRRSPKSAVHVTRKKHNFLQELSSPTAKDHSLIKRKYRPTEIPPRRDRSAEHWIPDTVRSKSMGRNLQVLKLNIEAAKTCGDALKRNSKWMNVSELDHNKTLENLRSKHRMQCALCEHQFSEINLKLGVPYKAIVDLRQFWSLNAEERNPGSDKKPLARASLLKAPICYDKVRVCCFCAQFLNDQDLYRPSYESKMEEKRKQEEAELAEQAALWWDPLRVIEDERKRQLQEAEEEALQGLRLKDAQATLT